MKPNRPRDKSIKIRIALKQTKTDRRNGEKHYWETSEQIEQKTNQNKHSTSTRMKQIKTNRNKLTQIKRRHRTSEHIDQIKTNGMSTNPNNIKRIVSKHLKTNQTKSEQIKWKQIGRIETH